MRRPLFNMDATDRVNASKLAAVQALGDIAEKADLTLVQMATAFVLRHPGVSSAVIGPRTTSHLEGYPPLMGSSSATTFSTRSTPWSHPA